MCSVIHFLIRHGDFRSGRCVTSPVIQTLRTADGCPNKKRRNIFKFLQMKCECFEAAMLRPWLWQHLGLPNEYILARWRQMTTLITKSYNYFKTKKDKVSCKIFMLIFQKYNISYVLQVSFSLVWHFCLCFFLSQGIRFLLFNCCC